MLTRVLIANRGEIAVRILRACQELGLETVAIYSKADSHLPHIAAADDAICVGAANVSDSYLNIANILMAAKTSGCDAIHPGYGFLAENADFARQIEAAELTFVGPSADVIELMGDKISAKQFMHGCGVPSMPGSSDAVAEGDDYLSLAEEIGFPVILKAVCGGGGRGMRIVDSQQQMANEISMARSEAAAYFGDGRVYLEKYLQSPRHVEVQILADGKGGVIHLGDRDCSIQRRYQKLLEEAPAPDVSAENRTRLAEKCVAASLEMGYRGAGTFEFMYAEGSFYFIEMNTRIQVEHPVTEMVTGVDLVKQQLKIAAGEKLQFTQSDIAIQGHAIECRINAEDEAFNPVPGTIESYRAPGGFGVRMDTHIYNGCRISHHYDSLVSKLICHGSDRAEAIARMNRALRETEIGGIETNIPLHQKIIADKRYAAGAVDVGYL
ncbi:MAG: acetyl-CoA carboxylase biotin carboxylase subunit [Pseudomonadales bacterium]|jgi:acetyl-CoA carboxylase biotin carboxylase subunit|nr:acetyl-CoA carboxylase biotin carboxylase subunit [Pseudomonadales bacterium]MDP7594501.1 acetyl-CoA carboxylase biotin carboxylase subunit [Pseudomonadales bacterium]HJN52711.1 acetyl-CoA carboxylase biotin carboxylase subunit [Pseudomonadales bacterium]|tara:strand:- start:301 stop:1617 length:1317 start_codon:yes stop_codon:yes gene_type:complete